ncbi:MAG: DeoR/GlpR family DNA-binding transcription regulator [Opitutales bacterium]
MPKPRRLLLEERRRQILEWVEADGNVTTGALLQKLDVSPMTLWRDLAWLEENALIKRTRGGALSTNFQLQGFASRPQVESHSVNDPQVDERRQRIAQRAVDTYVRDGQTLVIEDGPIARRLPGLLQHKELRLASPSLGMLALLARRNPDHEIFSCGGVLDPELLIFRGAEAEAFFARLPADCCFLTAHGNLSRATVARNSLDRMARSMMRAARQNILLAESHELSRLDLSQGDLPEMVHAIVTDDALPQETLERLMRQGVDVIQDGAPRAQVAEALRQSG